MRNDFGDHKIIKKPVILYVLLIAITFIGTIVFFVSRQFLLPLSSYGLQREIVNSTSQFEQLWAKSGVTIFPFASVREGVSELFLVSQDENVIFLGYQGPLRKVFMYNFDVLTGDLNWQSQINEKASAVVYNRTYIYVGSFNSPAGSFKSGDKGSILITAYDFDHGQIKWSSTYKGLSVISYMVANEQEVGVTGTSGHGVYHASYHLDATSGDILSSQRLLDSQPFTLPSGQVANYDQWTTLSDGTLVVRATQNEIFALSPSTLQVLWDIDRTDIVSNFTVSNGTVYFLTSDGVLWGVNSKTGSATEAITFGPCCLSTKLPYQHHVASGEDSIIVYLGDSHQLFAFRFLPDG